MFYFDNYKGQRVLKSDFLNQANGVNAFFTTRNCDIKKLISDYEKSITPQQTHSDNVKIADINQEYPDTDGLIISKPNIAIYLRFADCTPLIFYDPINKVGAVSHAGWRGTAAKIGVKSIEKMVKEFNTKPSEVIAIVGPAIGKCCYEVSQEVCDTLLDTVNNKNNLYDGKYVDLKSINARQLEEIGVTKIDICPYCTSCDNDLFYSYRKENGTKERHFAFLAI